MAAPIETHYDVLNVTPSAPIEVIKASYRVLSQKYHPDRNPADPEALRRMQRINQAWDVLSDETRRATHDRWIASQQSSFAQTFRAEARAPQSTPTPDAAPLRPAMASGRWQTRHTLIIAAVVAFTLTLVLASVRLMQAARLDDAPALESSTAPAAAPSQAALSERQGVAPPAQRPPHGYLRNERQYFSEGLSSLDIDNRGGADAEVRLYRNGRPVRSMYLHGGERFLVEQLPPGTYVLKYKLDVAGTMHAYQLDEVLQVDQGVEETDEGRRDRFSKLQVNLTDTTRARHEIALDQI